MSLDWAAALLLLLATAVVGVCLLGKDLRENERFGIFLWRCAGTVLFAVLVFLVRGAVRK